MWQINSLEKEKQIIEFKTSKEILKESILSQKVSEKEIIPASIVDDYEKLKEFIIKNKFFEGKEWSLEYDPYLLSYFLVFREDLNGDNKRDVVVGLSLENTGRLGLLLNEGENYKLVNWIEINLGIESMELRKLPSKQFWAVVLKTGGGMGTGIFTREMRVYNYLNGQLKLTWRGSIEESISGWDKRIENTYYIYFMDNDKDGDVEIIQRGTEKEGGEYDEKGNLLVTKQNFVEKIFKWNHNSQQFEQILQK